MQSFRPQVVDDAIDANVPRSYIQIWRSKPSAHWPCSSTGCVLMTSPLLLRWTQMTSLRTRTDGTSGVVGLSAHAVSRVAAIAQMATDVAEKRRRVVVRERSGNMQGLSVKGRRHVRGISLCSVSKNSDRIFINRHRKGPISTIHSSHALAARAKTFSSSAVTATRVAQPYVLATAFEWLMLSLQREVVREQLQGAAALLLSALRLSESIPALPEATREIITAGARDLPPQTASMGTRSRVTRWIDAAAVLESQGLWQASWELLHLLLDRCRSDSPTDAARRAFVHARLGRVARVAGHVDDAEHWYRDALQLSERLPDAMQWSDARPHALLGLCILAVSRGNYAKGQSYARRVLHENAPTLYQVQAFLVFALIKRKLGRSPEALTWLWRAFDALPVDDVRQIDVLITLAETAVELQQPEAAVRARLAALALARTPRHAAAALSGLLAIAAHVHGSREVRFTQHLEQSAWGHALSTRLATPPSRAMLLRATQEWIANPEAFGLQPYDVTLLHIGAVRLALSMPDDVLRANLTWSERALDRVEELATRHAYNERLFELDALRGEWRARHARMTSHDMLAHPDRAEVAREEAASQALNRSRAVTRLVRERFPAAMDRHALLR